MGQLTCSRGHTFNTKDPHNWGLNEGDCCPMVMSYDGMGGTTYCRRILRNAPSAIIEIEYAGLEIKIESTDQEVVQLIKELLS